jgi:hypothetical protein
MLQLCVLSLLVESPAARNKIRKEVLVLSRAHVDEMFQIAIKMLLK